MVTQGRQVKARTTTRKTERGAAKDARQGDGRGPGGGTMVGQGRQVKARTTTRKTTPAAAEGARQTQGRGSCGGRARGWQRPRGARLLAVQEASQGRGRRAGSGGPCSGEGASDKRSRGKPASGAAWPLARGCIATLVRRLVASARAGRGSEARAGQGGAGAHSLGKKMERVEKGCPAPSAGWAGGGSGGAHSSASLRSFWVPRVVLRRSGTPTLPELPMAPPCMLFSRRLLPRTSLPPP